MTQYLYSIWRRIAASQVSTRDKPLSLLLVRHGETQWNREGRIQGVLDSPLTKQGEEQARINGELLDSLGVTDLIASPLGRAADTTRIMTEVMQARTRFDDRLKERNCGAWGGLTWTEAEQGYPEQWRARALDPYGFSPPGGESLVQLEPRVRGLASDIEAWMEELSLDGRRVGVVTHGITMRVLLKCLLELEQTFVSRIRCPNEVVYEVVFTSVPRTCQHYFGGVGPRDGLLLSEPSVLSKS